MEQLHYDVIICGGRVAGSALAAHLGKMGLRVLLLERSEMPSRPAASSPVIYSPSMALLDELGAAEHTYAANTEKVHRWVIQAQDTFTVYQPVPDKHGRDYAYAIDRERLDATLWNLAASHGTVDTRAKTTVTDLVFDNEQVVGVKIRDLITGSEMIFSASLVVGADGRFSTVARRTAAKSYDEHEDQPTAIYYAYWRGVRPVDDDGPAAHLVSTGGHYGLLLMESADDTTVVVIEGRADVVNPDGQGAEAFYLNFLEEHHVVWERLQNATQVTPVHGMKRIANLYRQAGGPGWVLVGDALHQKDPLDGQGIYDALFMAKALAGVINEWCSGALTWDDALKKYEDAVRRETLPMYHNTLARVDREIYTRRRPWFMHTFARWMYQDPVYRQRWSRLFVRDIDPETWFSNVLIIGSTLRGIWRDIMPR